MPSAYPLGKVSTHSRLKAAAQNTGRRLVRPCFNTQPPEGGWYAGVESFEFRLGFNTQPPEGGCNSPLAFKRASDCFNTQPPEGGWMTLEIIPITRSFQHTAA